MTRSRTYLLTAIAAVLFVALTWVLGSQDLFYKNWWDSAEVAYGDSAIFTYGLLALIILAGVIQAQQLPPDGVNIELGAVTDTAGQTEDPKFWRLITGNVYYAVLWLPLRFFIGRQWITAGEHKLRSSGWMSGGTSLKNSWERYTGDASQIHYDWYHHFLTYMLNHEWYTWFAKVIAVGEFLVGLGLLVGALVGIAAFFGTLMNFSFMLAGTASSNPVLFGLSVFLILGWKVAGYWGLDRYLLPVLGAPWKAGKAFGGEGIHPRGRGGTVTA